MKVVEILNQEELETDVKKHFRYVSFNSERIPVGLQPALEKLKGE